MDTEFLRQHSNGLDESMASLDISEGLGESSSDSKSKLAAELEQNLQRMLEEIDALDLYLHEKRKDRMIVLSKFRRDIENEVKFVKKNSAPEREAILRSSNTVSFAAIWATAKTCTGVIALKRKYCSIPGSTNFTKFGKEKVRRKEHRLDDKADVDIVAKDGLEWVKVSLKTERKIIFELARAGFGACDEDSEGDEHVGAQDGDGGSEGLLKQAELLAGTAQQDRVHYRHPQVRLVLPRLKRGGTKEVDRLLTQIEELGIIVQTAEEIPEEVPLSATTIQKIIEDPAIIFTDILNMDVNVMLNLVSDFAHMDIPWDDAYHQHINVYIEMECAYPIMPNVLWPACGGRKMVCTRRAADKFFELVDIIGTDTEKARAALVMSSHDESKSHLSQEQRIQKFQTLSKFPVPSEWFLPIEIIEDEGLSTLKAKLPPIVEEVCKVMTDPLHLSVFLYGWASGRTTITANAMMANKIERAIEENRVRDDDVGPDFWLASSCRPLLGKDVEKRKRKEMRWTNLQSRR